MVRGGRAVLTVWLFLAVQSVGKGKSELGDYGLELMGSTQNALVRACVHHATIPGVYVRLAAKGSFISYILTTERRWTKDLSVV